MNKMQQQVKEFHLLYGCPSETRPNLISTERMRLRYHLMSEELHELFDAWAEEKLDKCADALGDLLYVVFGTAIEFGLDMEPIVDEIHRSNLSKLGANDKPIYAANGKVLKGPNYKPPNIEAVLSVLKARAEMEQQEI